MDRPAEHWRTELRWAWRNLRARGWRAALAVLLLGSAIAANTIVFSSADSLVFTRVPYRDAGRLVEVRQRDPQTGQPGSAFMSVPLFEEWRKQTDLFIGLHGSLPSVIFLIGNGEPELVRAADITVGLIELLGARPRWGRPFVNGDDHQIDLQPVLVAETLARERFGDPARAVGQKLETTAEPLIVIGVMPAEFRYPDGAQRIWRALDPRGPFALGVEGISHSIARASPGVSLETLAAVVDQRSAAIGTATGSPAYRATTTAIHNAEPIAQQRRMLLALVGAGLCLLLIACANVASLELASAVSRARTYAIQLAVGASRASLARTAIAEGACLVLAALLVACGLAYLGIDVLVRFLPPALRWSANPIDVDERALLFMLAIAALTWLMSSLPVVSYAWRANLLDVLKLEGHSMAASRRGTLVRRALTVVQVSLAVLLLTSSALYVRSYLALLRLEKGFDSSGVVSIGLTIPPQLLSTLAEQGVLVQTILQRVRATPGVVGAFEGAPPPSTGDSPMNGQQIEVDDRPPADMNLQLPRLRIEPDYFSVLRIPIRAGRAFERAEPPTDVIVTEALARRLWPNGDAIGHRFRDSPKRPWSYVVGVVGHVRTEEDGTTGPDRFFQIYVPRQPPRPTPPAQAAPSRAQFGGPSYRFLTVTARVDSRSRAGDLYQTVRAVDPRNILKLEFVDDRYARQFADRLLATRVIGSFGALAFVVSAAGIYGLMAFLVAGRSREIGIRMALGADRTAIQQLVLGSSLRLVGLGAMLGIAAALAASRWLQSQLFGVQATDPPTIVLVTSGVVVTALLATWQPARQATRIDPKTLLRN